MYFDYSRASELLDCLAVAPFDATLESSCQVASGGNPGCINTRDTGMKRVFRQKKGTTEVEDHGPGVILPDPEVSPVSTLIYVIGYGELKPPLIKDDKIEIWANTHVKKKLVDRAPNVNKNDGCSFPEAANEVLQITLP